MGPWNWLIVGMLPMILLHFHCMHEKYTKILELSKGTILIKGAWFANIDMLTTSNPDNVHHVLSTNFSNYPKGPKFRRIFNILGNGLFNSDFDEWRKIRGLAQGFVNHKQFHRFMAKINHDFLENKLVPVLDNASQQNLVVDLQDVFQRLMLDATCITATSYNPNSLCIGFPEVPFLKALDNAGEAIFFRHLVPEGFLKSQRWLGIGKEKKLSKACEVLDHIVAKYISMRQEELGKGKRPEENKDSFDALKYQLTETEIFGTTPTNKYMRDAILGLIFAGQDSTSAALTWLFWLLSKNPSVETNIKEELKSKLPVNKANKLHIFTEEELNKLVYLHGALYETLRLFPPAPLQVRTCIHPDTLPSGHKVNSKMKIVFSAYAMGRMTSVWGNDCLEFKPERWITEKGGIKHVPSHKFLAFSAGPRICLGKESAITRIKSVAAVILHNYHVQVMEGQFVTPKASIVLHMKNGLRVRNKNTWP